MYRILICFSPPMTRPLFLVLALTVLGGFSGIVLSQEAAAPAPPEKPATAPAEKPSGKEAIEAEAKIEAGFKEKTKAIASATEKLAGASTLLEGEGMPDNSTAIDKATLRERAALVKASLDKVRVELQAHRDEEQRRLDRMNEIPQLIETLNSNRAKDSVEKGAAADSSELVDQKIAALQAERDYYRAAAGLFAANGVYLGKRSAALELSNTAWQALVDNERIADAKEAEESAKENVKTIKDDPKAEAIAKETAKLAEESRVLTQDLIEAKEELSSLTVLRQVVSDQYANAKRRVNLLRDAKLPIDSTTGRLLRSQRKDLPSPTALRNQLRESLRDAAQVQLDLFERESDLTRNAIEEDENGGAVEAARTRLVDQLRKINKDSRDYLSTLSETAAELRGLSLETEQFAEYIDERLLWIQSSAPIALSDINEERQAIATMLKARPLEGLWKRMIGAPVLLVVAIAILGLLCYRLPAHHRILEEQGRIAERRSCHFIRPTLISLLMTLLIAMPIPFVSWYLFSRAGDTSAGVVEGLRNLSAFLTLIMFFLALTLPDGILVKHIGVSEDRVSLLRRNLKWVAVVIPPLIFLANALPVDSPSLDSAGRIFFIFLVACPMIFFIRILNPARGLVRLHGEPSERLAWICFLLGLFLPALLIIGAASGFYASVQQLRIQILLSVLIVVTVLFLMALLHRWILVSRRRMVASRKEIPSVSSLQEEGEESHEKEEVVKIEEQTLRLVRAAGITFAVFGLWGVWLSSLPALAVLDSVTLWKDSSPPQVQTTVNPLESVTSLSGVSDSEASESVKVSKIDNGVVSLQDLLFAMLTLVLTFVAANNIPGLIALAFSRHLRIDAGNSFAITTTIRYLIMFVGFIIAFAWIDITWGKVQWLAAAVTVGIGFGLQEIFANFVAGLILLFEKPIRIGDTVTVGDVSGKVTQIRIRATTIRQFNHRELVVPNKEFITGQLVNWTLSDSVLRVEVLVGIAYGSDTERARQILYDVAAEDESILDNPEPRVLFTAFGDSTLNFELRAQVGAVEDLVTTQSRLHFEIDKRFREAGIEIAFPQQDIHIRSGLPHMVAQVSAEGEEKELGA
ncbi:mechanosensitive ion channel domain-containing protein [Verrucomicrobiales bacterium BCK34]|nr:mechanosensitive ion channel domain-containing protein [Verrucomicrobiales bacterium BCK34]